MKTFIILTSQVEYLAKRIKRKLKDFEIIFPDLSRDGKRYFPDGEVYMKILKAGKLKNERVIVLHSGAPKPNEGLIELEMILQILKDNQIRPEVFFTYFPYGMQDEIFEKGETNVAENLIKKLINYYKVKKIYLIDPHFGGRKWVEKYPIISISAVPLLIKKLINYYKVKKIYLIDPHFGGRKWVEKYPIISISAVPILIEKAKEDFGKNILFLSPDIGGQRRTKISGVKKERLNSYRVKMISPKLNLKGKIIGIIDDIIKTGGTLLKFREIAKKSGAKKVIALITHGVMPVGISKIKRKYSKLYLTNTIEQRDYNPPTASSRSRSERAPTNIDITNLILNTISKYG